MQRRFLLPPRAHHLFLSALLIIGSLAAPLAAAPLDHAGLEAAWEAAFAEVKGIPPKQVDGRLPAPIYWSGDDTDLREVAAEEIERLRFLGHANVPLKVLMVLSDDTKEEVQAVFEVVKEINEATELDPRERLKLHIVTGRGSDVKHLDVSEEDARNYVEMDRYFTTGDIWMQDWGEIAAVQVKGAEKEQLVVFDAQRGRGLAELPAVLAREWSGNYLRGPKGRGAGNYGGNIEVTPDDHLVVGNTSTESIRELFAGVGYADRTVVLDTDWLVVGHVDEYLSTLPAPDEDLGYVLVKADPTLALEIMEGIPDSRWQESLRTSVLSAFQYADRYPDVVHQDRFYMREAFLQVGAIHTGLQGVDFAWDEGTRLATPAELVAINRRVAATIDANVAKLVTALKARHGEDTPVRVVSFPALFHEMHGKSVALQPGVVNMVVLRDHLMIPAPLIPEFRAAIAEQCARLGYSPHFIPNLSYHRRQGQLHCGTNVFRHPNRYVHPRFERSAAYRTLTESD